MRKRMRKLAASVLAVALGGGVMAGCGSTSPSSGANTPSSHYTLTVATTAGPLARNFNPFLPTSVSLADNVASFIYEPLVQWNPFKPQSPTPWLATSWSWSDRDRTLTMNLRKGVRWSDGSPFTSKDVVETFDLIHKYPAANTNGVSFASVSAKGPHQVVFHFAQPSYSEFFNLSANVYIVSAKIWSKLNPTTYADPDPVGTGPYELTSFSTQGFILTKNAHYWQKGKPVVYQLRFPSYNGNGPANVAVETGQAQWAGQFVPNIEKVYLSKSRHNHDWSPATSQVYLMANTAKYPFNILAVRQAVNYALNRPYIAKESEDGQATAQVNATGILPNESQFVAPQYKNDTFTYDPAKAKAILRQAGWTPGPGGVLQKGGKPLSFTLMENSGFTDYMTGGQVIASELNAIGMHVTLSGVSNNAWTANEADGDFDLTTMYSNVETIDPEFIFDGWLDSGNIHGSSAGNDYNRWNDPQTQGYFRQYLMATTQAQRLQAISEMEGVMVKDIPVWVLYGGPDWTQYNDQTLVGWPTPSDPYDPGAPFIPNNEVVVLHLHFRK